MERTGFQRELRDREVDVECRGFGPSFNMDNTHYHDCFEVYFQISGDRNLLSGGRFHHLEPGSVLWIPKFDLHQSFQGQQDTGTRAVLYFREEYLRGVLQERAGELLALFAGPFQVMRLDVFQRRKAAPARSCTPGLSSASWCCCWRPGPGRGAPCPRKPPPPWAPSTTG